MSRQYDRQLRFPAVRPVGGGSLGIEVDDGGVLTGSGRSDGEVQGQGGLSGAAFLADDGDGFHERIVNVCTSTIVREITICVKAKRADQHAYRGYSAGPGEGAKQPEKGFSPAPRLPGVETRIGRLWLPGPHLEPRYRRRRNAIARSRGERVTIV